MDPIQPFDWHRMFLGDQPLLYLLEVVFRTAFLYFYALVIARLIGKRGVGQLSPFEFIIVIVMGSAAGDPMFYPDVPLIHGMLVLTTVVFMQQLLTFITRRSEKVHDFVESRPTLVVLNGEIQYEGIKNASLDAEELRMLLRTEGITNISKVRRAFFEPSGTLSVFKKSERFPKNNSTKPRDVAS